MDPGVSLIEEVRDGRVHVVHTGHAAHLDAEGDVVASWGDPDTATYWRSAPKPLQAIPFAMLLDDLGLDDRHLALACASHSGEQVHLEVAADTLHAAGLHVEDLRCASHPGMTKHSIRPADGQQAIHNNCSGKHAAMLAVCKHEGWDTETYWQRDHPLQQRILQLVTEATGHIDIPTGTDGCGIPTFWLPITDLARTYQWLDRHPIGTRCLDAMAAHPYLVAGRDRFCTDLATATGGRLVGKVGAAGVYVILDRTSGEALVLKMVAGSAPAAETLAAHLAKRAGWLPETGLERYLERQVKSCAGKVLGLWEARL